MNCYRIIAVTAIIIGLSCWYVLGAKQAIAADGIEDIRALYSRTNKLITEKKAREILLHTGPADRGPGPYENKKDKWYRVDNANDTKAFEDSDYKARAYLDGDKVVKAVVLSVSEGWNNTVEYYFYENGNTAFVFERLNTEQGYDSDKDKPLPSGPYIVEWRTYFDKNGKLIKELKKAFYQSNKQEIPVRYIRTSVMTYGFYYPDVSSLPFFSGI